MATVAEPTEAALVARVTELTEQAEALPDPHARQLADELAAAIVQLYGEGLERIVAALDAGGVAALAGDELVANLLLIHGLHPVPLETRVQAALDGVRPYLASHDGDVELLGLVDGIASLRLQGSCKGCGASRTTLELAIERALEEAAPDLRGLDVEGVAPAPPRREEDLGGDVEWVALDGAADLARGAIAAAAGLLVANVAGTLLAYHDACAACAAPLTDGVLLGGRLTCATCGATFDLPRAGRCVADGELQLRPVPLLRNGGPVRVALVR
ncbi:Fe/S biogenesis protein NfuA [Baekduia alba]|uniref:NifU family protein n=1 Tax=Baekduia alba TaxID=2997333 RepID=UPI0023408025|nr:NifU family protein [Baekduia alba]WCB95122.1 Fe/S biogenesis protein NfuA [Baekduia alba]